MKLRFKRNLKKAGAAGPLGLYRLSKKKGKRKHQWTLQLDPVRLSVLFGILFCLAYVAAVIGAYTIRSKRPYNQITLSDIAFPWNWPGLDEKAGATNLAHGKALFEDGDLRGAFHMLRSGLKRKPDDHEARLKLAQLNYAVGASEDATNILDIGLTYGYPADENYIQLLLILLTMREDFDAISSVSHKLRQFPEVKEDQELWQKLAEIELSALKKNRNFEQLLKYAQEMRAIEPNSARYEDLQLLSMIKLGFIDQVEAQLNTFSLARKHSPQCRYLQAMIALQNNELEELDKLYDTIMRWPTKPYPLQSQMIIELNYAGLNKRRDQRIAEYVARHQGKPTALIMALRLFYKYQTTEQNDTLIEQITELDPDNAPKDLELLSIQSLLLEKQYTEAQKRFKRWVTDNSGETPEQYLWLEQLLMTLVEKRQDDRVDLWEMMHAKRLPNEAYKLTVNALIESEDFETAERIAENGLKFYPHDEKLAELRRSALTQR
ncbi:tetratricopeptide repeat protein [Cerasicoccus maritimus]|uniref:tetratricopeptide repeat protein n=1 Tax=Cerasicoccus maritimus TaxID=490089 RepID=UPI00285294CA|nr:tetratricopeptide repeat protein [Cerasicoccus maritimus]